MFGKLFAALTTQAYNRFQTRCIALGLALAPLLAGTTGHAFDYPVLVTDGAKLTAAINAMNGWTSAATNPQTGLPYNAEDFIIFVASGSTLSGSFPPISRQPQNNKQNVIRMNGGSTTPATITSLVNTGPNATNVSIQGIKFDFAVNNAAELDTAIRTMNRADSSNDFIVTLNGSASYTISGPPGYTPVTRQPALTKKNVFKAAVGASPVVGSFFDAGPTETKVDIVGIKFDFGVSNAAQLDSAIRTINRADSSNDFNVTLTSNGVYSISPGLVITRQPVSGKKTLFKRAANVYPVITTLLDPGPALMNVEFQNVEFNVLAHSTSELLTTAR